MILPKVTVLIPVHGECPFISATLDSIMSQTYKDFEILIINDRASTETIRVIQEFKNAFDEIRILESPGVGLVQALNFGIGQARGEFIARIDADDFMHASRIKEQYEYLCKNSDVAVVGSQMTLIGLKNESIGVTKYPISSKKIQKVMKFQNCIGHPSVMYRKSTVLAMGAYDQVFEGAEDYELWSRILIFYRVSNLDSRLTYYRISPGQYSKRIGSKAAVLSELIRLKIAYPCEYQNSSSNQVIGSSDESLKLNDSLTKLRYLLERNGHTSELNYANLVSRLTLAQGIRSYKGRIKIILILFKMFFYRPKRTFDLIRYHLSTYFASIFSRL